MPYWQLRSVEPERAQQYGRDGFWDDQSLGGILAAGIHDAGDEPFNVRSAVRPWRGTLADVDRLARSVAGGLLARGVRSGDAVAFQLPNWVEAAATFYAA